MRYLHWFLSFALVYLLGACSSTEDNGDMVPAPNTVEQMLELSSGFVITNFADYRQTTAEELGGEPEDPILCRLAAEMQLQSDMIMARADGEPTLTISSFCSRCSGEVSSICAMSEWHYLVPDETEKEYAVFFISNSTCPELPNYLVALFEVVDGQVDMTPLPDGEMVAVEDMAAYLQGFNTDPDNRTFLP